MRRSPTRLLVWLCATTVVAGAVSCGTSGRDLRAPEPNAVQPTRSTAAPTAAVTTATTQPAAAMTLTSPAFAAVALTFCSYAALTGYDPLAFAALGKRLPRWRVAVASFLAYAVANSAEDQAACSPTRHENGCRIAAPLFQQLRRGAFQQIRNGRIAGDNEKLLVQAIEQPGE